MRAVPDRLEMIRPVFTMRKASAVYLPVQVSDRTAKHSDIDSSRKNRRSAGLQGVSALMSILSVYVSFINAQGK